MDSPEDLSAEQFSQALDQSWTDRSSSGGADLLIRMRDSLAAIDVRDEAPKLTKEQFLAELSRSRS